MSSKPREDGSERVSVCFHVRSAGAPVYLMLSDAAGRRLDLCLMEPRGEGVWQVQLELLPGEYRYRYYICEGGVIFCCPPAHSRPGRLDALLRVPAAGDVDACAQSHSPYKRRGPVDAVECPAQTLSGRDHVRLSCPAACGFCPQQQRAVRYAAHLTAHHPAHR